MAETQQHSTFPASQQQMSAAGDQKRPVTSHKGWFVALVVVNVAVLLVLFALNGLNGAGPSSGIFVNTISNQSRKYYLDITPAGWTFSIWGFIYTWQALWVLYSVVNLFRKTPQGPAYLNPPFLPPALFVLYIIANVCCIAWLFLFDRDHIQGAFVSLFLLALFLVCGLGVSYKILDKYATELVDMGRTTDIWLVRGFVHNGLGIYGTWTAIASLLNLNMVIAYSEGSDISVSTGGTVSLGVLTAELMVFVSTDLLLLDRYSRYTLTPYIVVVVALIGSITKNWSPGATNSIFSAALLALASLALLVKIVLTIYRHVTQPLYIRNVSSTLSADVSKKNFA